MASSILEAGSVRYNSTAKFENISGQFRPDLISLQERFTLVFKKRPPDKLFTPQLQETATKIIDCVNNELGAYGVPSATFNLDGYRLHTPAYGQNLPISGVTLLSHKLFKEDLNRFVHVFMHEHIHFVGARVLKNGRIIRDGTAMTTNENAGQFNKLRQLYFKANTRPKFTGFNEGITEKTTRRLMRKHFPDIEIEKHAYDLNVRHIDYMCKRISLNKPEQYPSPEDAFILFEGANYGHGRMTPLIREVVSTYGRNNFPAILEVFDGLESDRKLLASGNTNQVYLELEEFFKNGPTKMNV